MQEAVPVGQGTMAVVLGLPDDDVRAACAEAAAAGGVVEAVNFNAPAQVVIAGDTAAVERACEIAKGKGAKRAMKLPVSAPFHSSLLKPASDRLRDYLANITFAAPQIELINNVDVAVLNDPAAIKDALVRQAAAPVRWVVECGPGKVLMGLTKRIDANLVGDAIYDQATLDRVLSELK
jgi:[acyl-carrier-protein] S-malonyltransferase